MRFFASLKHSSGTEENRRYYLDTMNMVDDMLNGTTTDAEKAEIYSFAIDVLARELAYVYSSRIFRKKNLRPEYGLIIPVPEDTNTTKINDSLTGKVVVSPVYNAQKYRRAISDVLTGGFIQKAGSYQGTYYPEINLVVAQNGLHHLSVASCKNIGSAELNVVSLKRAFQTLRTDGAFWYKENVRQNNVVEYRIAILYELARRRNELVMPPQFESSIDSFQSVRKYPLFEPGLIAHIYVENQFRVDLLELELKIKEYQLEVLRGKMGQEKFNQNLCEVESAMNKVRSEFNDWTAKAEASYLRFMRQQENL